MTKPCISAGAPCQKPETLFVEVAGTDIHTGYGLVLEKNGESVADLAMTQKKWHQRYECDYAVSAAEQSEHTLTLTVEKEEGGDIRMPLMDSPSPTKLSARTQPNLLFPVYPLASLPQGNDSSSHSDTPYALLRPGYLYVFWKGILWRELATDAEGKLRDVDLPHWREQAKQATQPEGRPDERPAAGVPLDTLWVPARFQQAGGPEWTIGDVELAWSEQQWSWDYIASLESGQEIIKLPASYREQTGIPAHGKRQPGVFNDRRAARCESLESLRHYDYLTRFGPEAGSGKNWLLLNQAAPCRSRNPNREKQAADPFQVIQALDGEGLKNNTVLQNMSEELQRLEGYACKAEEAADFAGGLTRWMDDLIGEDWRKQFGGDQPEKAQGTERGEAARKELLDEVRRQLKSAPEADDQLANLRERHIPAVVLPDLLFELEWLTAQTSLHLNHLSVVAQSAQQHPHFKSAMLLNSAMFDRRGHERGPFDQYRYAVDETKLDEALRKEDREACRAACYDLIQRRTELLDNRAFPVFNDLFALNGLRYPIALQTLNPMLAHLDTSVFHFDALAGQAVRDKETLRDQTGARFIEKLAKGQTPLASFLTVDPNQVPLDKALETFTGLEPNDGSGKPRPAFIQWLQTYKPAPDEVPEALREQYELSKEEREKVYENIRYMEDPELQQWAVAAYTTMGQLMADLTSEFYLHAQRALLGSTGKSPVYHVKDSLQIPIRYMKLGNPFLRDLVMGHAYPMMQNADPGMVPLGIRFGEQATGIGHFSNEAIEKTLQQSSGASIVRPKGGVINRVGPDKSGSYGVIRNGNGRLIANTTSVAGLQGNTPVATVQVEMFLAEENSTAARMSRGFTQRSRAVLMRWAPPGMLGLFGLNVISSARALISSGFEKGLPLKELTALLYGIVNSAYWLGHIVEAENLARETRLSWLTKVRVDVEQISDDTLKSVARRLFSDRLLSIAKFAGVAGAALEVVLSLWEGIERVKANDTDAAAGYFVAAAGFGVFMFSHWAGTSLVPILGISMAAAVAIVALAVALAALVWAIFRTDSGLETWLKHGPFGKEEISEKYQHLQSSPEDAFQFLVGALFPLTGQSGTLSSFSSRKLLSEQEVEWLLENDRTEGYVMSVQSAAFLLVDKPEEQFRAHFWLTLNPGNKIKTLTPDYVYFDAARQMLRFHLPKRLWRRIGRGHSLEGFKAEVQVVLGNGGLLPVSKMDEPLVPAVDEPGANGDDHPRWLTITS